MTLASPVIRAPGSSFPVGGEAAKGHGAPRSIVRPGTPGETGTVAPAAAAAPWTRRHY